MDRKQYAKSVVVNIIHFMAQAGIGIEPTEEEFNKIPEDLRREVIGALLAAKHCRKIATLAAMSKAFPLDEILEKIKKEVEEQSKKD